MMTTREEYVPLAMQPPGWRKEYEPETLTKTVFLPHALLALVAGGDRCNFDQLEETYHINIWLSADTTSDAIVMTGDRGSSVRLRFAKSEIEHVGCC